MGPAVFLDRDGTLGPDQHFLSRPGAFRLYPETPNALAALARAGFALVVVSNQSGVGRGYFSRERVESVNDELRRQLRRAGVELAGVFVCPHHPDDGCACRKPAPGLLWRAAKRLSLDLRDSYLIGDRPSDIGAGRAAGCRTIWLGQGRDWSDPEPRPDAIVGDLGAAASVILAGGVAGQASGPK